MTDVEVSVLGPPELRVDGRTVVLPGPKQRVLLATLASEAGRVVSAARLVDALWDDDPPRSAEHSIQQHVSVIRKQLEAAGVPDPSTVLVTRPPGYVLVVDRADGAGWDEARATGAGALAGGDPGGAIAAFDRGLGLWRGTAFEGVDGSSVLRAAAVRLEEQRIDVRAARADALLVADRPTEAVADLEALVAVHPAREALWAALMLALYRSGRQADALAAFQSARRALVDGLGIEPGARLRDLESAILEQRPSLDPNAAIAPPAADAADAELLATYLPGDVPELGRVVLPDGQEVVLREGTAVVGRDPSVLVRLVDNRVSRRHASIEVTCDRCVLRDLASSNGTTVNGEPVSEVDLVDGDVIGVGGVHLGFCRTVAQEPPSPPTR